MRNSERFTDRAVDALKPKPQRYELVEPRSGLALRVNPSGVKTFSYLYWFNGGPRRATLGAYRAPSLSGMNGATHANGRGLPYLSLADARMKLAECQKLIEAGVDPAVQQVATHELERQAGTVEKLAQDFIEKHSKAKKRPRSASEDERMLNRDVIPAWGKRRAKDIGRGDVVALLDDVAARAPITANRLRACLSKMFRWAARRGLVPSNPVAETDKPAIENPRTRVLSDAELKAVWAAAGSLGKYGRIVRLLMLTGQRREQISGGEWSEYDEAERMWIFGAGRTKTGDPLALPLSRAAIDILAELPREHKTEPLRFMFPSLSGADSYFAAHRYWKARLDKAISEASPDGKPMAPWVIHDLRRTMRTRLSGLGVSPDIAELVIGHRVQGVRRVYDLHRFDDEKRAALDLWANELARIVAE